MIFRHRTSHDWETPKPYNGDWLFRILHVNQGLVTSDPASMALEAACGQLHCSSLAGRLTPRPFVFLRDLLESGRQSGEVHCSSFIFCPLLHVGDFFSPSNPDKNEEFIPFHG